MTCIVGITDKEKVYIGGDSRGSDYWGVQSDNYSYKVFERDITHGDDFKTHEPILFGVCASFRIIDILTYAFELPEIHPEENVDRYMRTRFIEALHGCLEDNKAIKIKNEVAAIVGDSDVLVGIRGNLYTLQADFSVLSTPDYGMSVGSGYQVALGALYTLDKANHKSRKDRVKRALEAAGACVGSVHGPYYIKEI